MFEFLGRVFRFLVSLCPNQTFSHKVISIYSKSSKSERQKGVLYLARKLGSGRITKDISELHSQNVSPSLCWGVGVGLAYVAWQPYSHIRTKSPNKYDISVLNTCWKCQRTLEIFTFIITFLTNNKKCFHIFPTTTCWHWFSLLEELISEVLYEVSSMLTIVSSVS